METKEIARLIADAALETKAIDLVVLNLTRLTSFTDYFVVCSGASDRQVKSIAEAIVTKIHKSGLKVIGTEGEKTGQWILVDCGDVVVHIFHMEVREYYDLEKLWSDAPREKI